MKKVLSLFMAFIMVFGVAVIGITVPHTHAEEIQQTYTEGNFVYTITGDYATITDYTDKESTAEIVIPDALGGYPVTELAAESFKGCLCTAVTIPASVTNINVEAFAYDMPNLERYTVNENNSQYSSENGILYSGNFSYKKLFAYPKNAPEETLDLSVAKIFPFAFTGVQNLKSISLTSLTNKQSYNIQKYAFYNATSLESVAMGDYISSIGDYAFASCPSLESASISDVVENLGWEIFADTPFISDYNNFNSDGVMYLDNNLIATHPLADKENYNIQMDTESIAGGAFQWNSLKKVYFPASVEYIKSNPFAKCPNLETFTFHSESDFSVNGDGLLLDGYTVIAYPNGIYRSCYSINYQTIRPYAFYLSPVKNIYAPSGFTSVGYCALGGEGVTDIHYGSDESSWNSARYVKKSYETMTLAEDVATIRFKDYSNPGHTVIANSGIQSVCSCGYTAEHAYADGSCTEDGFVYAVFGKTAVITGYKFKESTDAVVIPETIDGYPVTKLERGAFRDCMFTSVQIPANVTEIDPEAFAYALNNQSFTVAEGNKNFKAIDGVLFENSSDTVLVAYPQNAPASEYTPPSDGIEILPYAFCGSKNLKAVNSWQSVILRDYAFVNSSVETVSGSDFQHIGSGAFKNSALKEFSIISTPEFFGYNVFEGTPFLENAVYDEDGAFYHENILVATQKEADKNYYEIKAGTTVVAGGAFVWESLEEVYIPESVETVNGSSFSHAASLKTFTLDSNNKHFGIYDNGMLYDSARSKLIACPPAVEMICYGIPKGITEIGAFAFNNVKRVRCVHIPSTVETVGEFAFGASEFNHISIVKYEGIEHSWNLIEFVQSGSDMIDCEASVTKYFNIPIEGHANAKTETTTEGSTVCTKVNVTTYTCACGCSWSFSTTPKGHVREEEYTVTNAPSCTVTGRESLYCTVCGKSVASRTIPALGHDYELIEHIKPTCEESGEKTYKCTRCNTKKTEVAESPLGHTSSGETVKIDPTCTEDGGLYNLCDRCNEPIYDECFETYPATGHTEGEWKCTQEPTCTYQQVDTLFCSACTQAIETKTGDYGTHIYRDELVAEDCTYRCYVVYCIGGCGDEYYEEIVAPDDAIFGEDESGLGHIVEEVITEPTCTKPGKKYNRCTVCGETVGEVTELSEALGHNKWEEISYQEPTCYEEGYIFYRCTVCRTAKLEDLPMIPHTFEEWKYENGNLFSGECTYCGEIFENIEVELTLDSTELTLDNQSSETLSVTVTEHITDDFVFTSSDTNIAEVDSNGTITAKAPGNAIITVKINGTEITAQCEVTVKARRFGVEWIVDGKLYYYSHIREGANIETPDAPEKAGYVFAGWSPEVPETMPSSSLTFTAVYSIVTQSDKYNVSATYLPGCFDEEIYLDVAEIEGEREPGGVYMVEGEYYKQIGLYNIKTVNENGEVVQPNEGYKVTVRIAIPETYKNYTSFMIYHRFTGGGREQLSTENGTLKIENGYLVFDVTKFSEFEIFVPSAYIKITQLPDKTVYYYNTAKELDLSGLRIRYTKPDGTTKTLTDSSPLTVTGFDGSKVGKQTVTVKYGQYSDTFEVTVKYNWWQWIIHVFFGWLMR